MSYILGIIGYVAVVCNYNGSTEQLLCNNPTGFDVVAVDSNNNNRLLDSSTSPVKKRVRYVVKDNENVIVAPRPTR